MNGQSLAEKMVYALAKVSAIGEDLTNQHPLRHNVQNMKQTAERILMDAAEQATGLAYQATKLAYQADQLISDFEKQAAKVGEE